jgi:hypothetical protein
MIPIRSRLLAIAIVNSISASSLAVITELFLEMKLWDWLYFSVSAALFVIAVIEDAFAFHYLNIIDDRHGLEGDQRLMLYSKSILFLRNFAMEASAEMEAELDRIFKLEVRARVFPELLEDRKFLSAIHGFKYEKAEAMVAEKERLAQEQQVIADRSAQALATEQARRAARPQLELQALRKQCTELGIFEEELEGKGASALRDLIETAQIKKDLRRRASPLGCLMYVESLIRTHDLEGAKVFVLRVEKALEDAKKFGVEDQAREFFSYGNSAAAEVLLVRARNEAAAAELKCKMEKRMRSIPVLVRAPLEQLLTQALSKPYGSREFNKALHAFEEELAKHDA